MAEEDDPQESGTWSESATKAVSSRMPTWFQSAEAVREEKERLAREADAIHKEEREDKADGRVDKFAGLALDQATARAKAAEKTTRTWQYFSGFLVLVVCILAGHAVGITIPGVGSFTGGGDGGIELEVADPTELVGDPNE